MVGRVEIGELGDEERKGKRQGGREIRRERRGRRKKSIGGAEKEVKKGRLEVKRLEVKGVDAIKSDYICSNNSYTYRCIKQ